MEANAEKINGDLVKRVFYADRNTTSKIFPKLTDKHFTYDTFEKMRVNLAVQVLSNSVATGLQNVIDTGHFKSSSDIKVAKATVTFIGNMNNIFDLLNAKATSDPILNKRGVSKNNIDELKMMHNYVLTLKKHGSTVYWITGLAQTIKGIIELYEEMVISDDNFVLLTRNLNQDPLENLFGLTRAQGGNNRNPYLIDFIRNVSRIMTSKLLITPKETNCEMDDTTAVQIVDLSSYSLPANYINPAPVHSSFTIFNFFPKHFNCFRHFNISNKNHS